MSQFNFLSGSSIDNSSNFLFDALDSGQCYLGFSRGTPDNQWGISALVFIEHPAGTFPTNVAVSGDTINSDKFFDLNSVNMLGASVDSKRAVNIVKVDSGNHVLPLPSTGILTLSYISKNWALIQGLNKDYYNYLKPETGVTYYLQNWSGSATALSNTKVKILNKSFINVPFYTTNCQLFMQETSGSPYVMVQDGIQKTSNILGETYVTGMLAPESIPVTGVNKIFIDGASASMNKNILKNAKFVLKDISGNVILDNMYYVDPEVGTTNMYTEVSNYEQSQKYLTFKYLYIDGKYQYIKFIIGSNEIDALAIWQEALPFESTIPVADANPPALDISYIKNPTIASSIMDVNGLTKIKSNEITYVKEITNTTASGQAVADGFEVKTIILTGENVNHAGILRTTQSVSGATTIPLYDFHSFVIGDSLFIPYKQSVPAVGKTYTITNIDTTYGNSSITLSAPLLIDEPLLQDVVFSSNPTNVTASIMLACTSDKDKALSFGFYNALIEKNVPITNASSSACPTENIYRQLFIAYKPKDSTGALCSNDIYNGDANIVGHPYGAIFNTNTWKTDIGMLLYLSNKIPVYRKWANTNEEFKIIL